MTVPLRDARAYRYLLFTSTPQQGLSGLPVGSCHQHNGQAVKDEHEH